MLVDQVEHGRLAGDIAEHWGNEGFLAPPWRDSFVLGATLHDEGWREADSDVLFNEREGRPLYFLEIEREDHVPLYAGGVERVFAQDPYAGLLVSMHWTGLYTSRWGIQERAVAFNENSEVQRLQLAALDHEERRWIEVKRALLGDARRSEFEAGLWHGYEVIQACDLLSLYVAVCDLEPAGAQERALGLVQALYGIDHAPGPRLVQAVPRRIAGERVDLCLTGRGDGVVVVDPYPFDDDPLEFELAAREIPDRRYRTADEARRAVAAAEPVRITCTMTGPEPARP